MYVRIQSPSPYARSDRVYAGGRVGDAGLRDICLDFRHAVPACCRHVLYL